jgi:hypothetical protein
MSVADDDGAKRARQIIHDDAEEVQWPDPAPLDKTSLDEKPYPIHAMPEVMAAAVKEYRAYGQQPFSLVACSAMAAASLAAQGLADVQRDPRLCGPISLYLLFVGISGERKSSSDKEFTKPFLDWTLDRRESEKPKMAAARAAGAAWEAERDGLLQRIKGLSGGKKGTGGQADIETLRTELKDLELRKPVAPIWPRLFYEDTNPAALAVDLADGWPSASLWSDEAGLVVGSHGMADQSLMRFIGLLNRLWDGGSFDRRRRTTESVTIVGRRFTACLMMQPVVLRNMLSVGDGAARGMGLFARCCIAWPRSTIGFRPYLAPAAGSPSMKALHKRLKDLLDKELPTSGPELGLTPPALQLSASGFSVWRDYYNEIETELGRWGEFGNIPDFGAKIADNAARIAGVFHVIENGPEGEISGIIMQDACAVAAWHLNEAKRLIGAAETAQVVHDAEALLEWMLRQKPDPGKPMPGPFETRRISQYGPAALRDRKRRDPAVTLLTDTHHLIVHGLDTKLHLNPKSKEPFNERSR